MAQIENKAQYLEQLRELANALSKAEDTSQEIFIYLHRTNADWQLDAISDMASKLGDYLNQVARITGYEVFDM